MKKIIALIVCVLCLSTLFACKGEDNSEIKKTLDKTVPNAYVGDVDIEQKITPGSLDIEIKEKTFYINGIVFYFREFEKAEKVSMNYEGGMINVYVRDGVFKKCEIVTEDSTRKTVYDINGKAISATEYVYDELGNAVLVTDYDGEGKLTGFYEALYKELQMREKREYNGSYDLIRLTRYYYSDKGSLKKEAVYNSELKLEKIIEH